VGCYIWYSEEGPERAAAPPSPLLAVPNVTAHPPTASVPTSCYSMWHCNQLYTLFIFYYFLLPLHSTELIVCTTCILALCLLLFVVRSAAEKPQNSLISRLSRAFMYYFLLKFWFLTGGNCSITQPNAAPKLMLLIADRFSRKKFYVGKTRNISARDAFNGIYRKINKITTIKTSRLV